MRSVESACILTAKVTGQDCIAIFRCLRSTERLSSDTRTEIQICLRWRFTFQSPVNPEGELLVACSQYPRP